MKKILSLLLVFIMLFLCVGCIKDDNAGSGKEVNFARSTYKPSLEYLQTFDNYGMIFDVGYLSFEERIERAPTTDIVNATFLGYFQFKPIIYLYFEINEIIKGDISDKIIAVPVYPSYYCFYGGPISSYDSFTDNDYEVGSDYLLLLNRYSTPHLDCNDLLEFPIDSLVIPLDSTGKPISSKSQMYNTELLSHVEDRGLKEKIENGNLIECLLELTEDDVYSENKFNTADITSVCSMAQYVWVIQTEHRSNSPVYERHCLLFGEYSCEILESFKGTPPELMYKIIHLTDSKVDVGKKYIVALDENFELVSRNAIFEIPE